MALTDDNAELAAMYWRQQRLGSSEEEDEVSKAWDLDYPEYWAYHDVHSAVMDGEPRVPLLMKHLAEGALTEDELIDLGTGPLEDFANAHPEPFVRQLLPLARCSPKLRTAIRSVFLRDSFPEHLAREVEEFRSANG